MSFLFPRRGAAAVAVLALALALPATARADDPAAPQCPTADVSSLEAVECSGVDPVPSLDPADTDAALAAAAARSAAEAALPHQCRLHSEAVFYTSSDWVRFARILSENTSYCADFYLSVPPLVADKRKPRPGAAAAIKAFGPQFHPMAEIHRDTWAKYIGTPGTPTWYDAGLVAGSTYQEFGYELWAVNEAPAAVRQGAGEARANLAQFLRGLRDGSGVQGLVFVTGVGQRTSPLDVYHGNLSAWLLDSLFWSTISDAVRFWAQETYGDVRAWAVPGASRNDRTRHLADYLLHGIDLTRSLGDAGEPARTLLERTFVALGNAAWPWPSSFGYTDVDATLMQSYVSEQVFAVRHFAGANPQGAPAGRFGAAYAPRAPVDVAGLESIVTRLASALHESYEEGGHSQVGACGAPGEHDWCTGELDGAAFVEGWGSFGG